MLEGQYIGAAFGMCHVIGFLGIKMSGCDVQRVAWTYYEASVHLTALV